MGYALRIRLQLFALPVKGRINVPYKAPLAPGTPNHLAINKVTIARLSIFNKLLKWRRCSWCQQVARVKFTNLTKTVAGLPPFVELKADGVVDSRAKAFHFS